MSGAVPLPEEFDVTGKAAEPIALPIAAGPATGYGWRLELPEGVERIEDGPPRPIDPSVYLGGASGGYLQVRAAPGDYVITAFLARPWDPDHPARIVKIRLHVD